MDPSRIDLLAESFRRGDRESFRQLVDGLSRGLIAQAWRYTGDWDTARDLSQETWLKVHGSIRRYDARRPFLPWLRTLHRNVCIGWLRREKRRRGKLELFGREPRAAADGADEALGRGEFLASLRRAMAHLSRRQQEVFVRVDLEDADPVEAARELGMKPATLRSTLHFARRRLARRLSHWEEGHEAS